MATKLLKNSVMAKFFYLLEPTKESILFGAYREHSIVSPLLKTKNSDH